MSTTSLSPDEPKNDSADEEDVDYSLSSGKVKHDYHDYANEADKQPNARPLSQALESTPSAPLSLKAQPSSCRPEENFPVKLHYMLADLERDGLDHIVSWQPHGRCFVVHKQQQFVQTVLPYWFRQTKFPSFQRQLNLYGFKRLTSGRDKNGYYHELFLRNKRFLAHRINRIKIKGTGARKPSSPETEPNFYALPFLPPEVPETVPHPGKATTLLNVGMTAGGAGMPGGGFQHPFIPRIGTQPGFGALPLGAAGGMLATNPSPFLPGITAQSPSGGVPAPAPVMLPGNHQEYLLAANLQRERLKQVLMATQGIADSAANSGLPGRGHTNALVAFQQQQQQQQALFAAQQLQQQHQQQQSGNATNNNQSTNAPPPGPVSQAYL